MKRVIIIEDNNTIRDDLEMTEKISPDPEYTMICLNTAEGLTQAVKRHRADLIVMSQNIMEHSMIDPNMGVDIAVYLEDEDTNAGNKAEEKGYISLGVLESSEEIMDAIRTCLRNTQRTITPDRKSSKPKPARTVKESKEPAKKQRPESKQQHTSQMEVYQSEYDEYYQPNESDDDEVYDDDYAEYDEYGEEQDESDEYPGNDDEEDFEEPPLRAPVERKRDYCPVNRDTHNPAKRAESRALYQEKAQRSGGSKKENNRVTAASAKKTPVKKRKEENNDFSAYKEKQSQPKDSYDIDDEIMEDAGLGKPKTKVVTVYSAKGGVGKTTIATELATYLSLITVGKDRLKVCLVDFNIDFGDVRATLALDTDGSNLAWWAGDVRERLERGQEDIQYNQEEIESWLRKDKNSGLYILPAPVTNEDSSEITGKEMEIILHNIMKHGRFDYIVCDTGNNTRNSTMVALENADLILLLMDQNINTANCDQSFMNTMNEIDFDLSKTRLVINRVMPKKATSISVQEIVEFFDFPCVGKLKFSTDVMKATNAGKPLAYQPDNDFTKQLREVVQYIIGTEDFNNAEPVKQDFVSKIKNLFKK